MNSTCRGDIRIHPPILLVKPLSRVKKRGIKKQICRNTHNQISTIYRVVRICIALTILSQNIFAQSSVVDPEDTTEEKVENKIETESYDTADTETQTAPPTGSVVTTPVEQDGSSVSNPSPNTEDGQQTLPNGFSELRFGMTLEEAKQALKGDPNFDFRGDPDVTLLRRPNETAIDTEGIGFVERGFFQFHEDSLYIIHLLLRNDSLDHFTMYSTLKEKYGIPDYLDPQLTYWEDEYVRIALERPLGVKYMWKETFQNILQESKVKRSLESMYRDNFLQQF